MSDLTSELNLITAQDDDDTADYLTIDLKSSLQIVDGLFNSATGHAHNGSHQGGALQFQDLTIGNNLTVNGALIVKGTAQMQAALTVGTTLSVAGATTLNTLHVTGTTQLDGPINSGNLTLSGNLAVGNDLTVGHNATVTGTLTAGAIGGSNVNLTGNLVVGGAATITGVLTALRGIFNGYDSGNVLSVGGSGVATGFFYQRSGAARVWDNVDFTYGIPAAGNTLVQRDANGWITANYINYAADLQPGSTRPVEVLGRLAGDHLLRWWPANAIGPPSVARFLQATLTLPALSNNGGTANAGVNTVSNSLGAGVAAGVITIPYAGYYSISGGFAGNNLTGNTETMTVSLISSVKGLIDNANCQLKISSFFGGYFSFEGLFAVGETIRLQFTTSFDSINGGGELILSFIPTADYPN